MEKWKSGREAVKSFQSKGGEEKIVKLFFNGEKRYPFSHPSTLMSLSEGREKRRKTRECILRCPPRPSRDPSNVSDRLSFFSPPPSSSFFPSTPKSLESSGASCRPSPSTPRPRLGEFFLDDFSKSHETEAYYDLLINVWKSTFFFDKCTKAFRRRLAV